MGLLQLITGRQLSSRTLESYKSGTADYWDDHMRPGVTEKATHNVRPNGDVVRDVRVITMGDVESAVPGGIISRQRFVYDSQGRLKRSIGIEYNVGFFERISYDPARAFFGKNRRTSRF